MDLFPWRRGCCSLAALVALLLTCQVASTQGKKGGPAVPKAHKSTEPDVGFGPWIVKKSVIPHLWQASMDLDRIMPEWVPVKDVNPAILEGVVVLEPGAHYPGPHVSFEDLPITHYTHDFCFHVRPDATKDNRFTNLLGIQVDPKTKKETQQPTIEVEWECGLAASNDGNICAALNRKGDSAGFYSAGHKRLRDVLWNWPTVNDWVHVVGAWIWDRGHPPADTEIHPPRLVAVRRDLPEAISVGAPPKGKKATNPVLSTRVDIFASGDGGALWNNRADAPAFVQRVKMSDRDYSFLVEHTLPRPSAAAKLRVRETKRPGDTFPANAVLEVFGDGSDEKKAPHVRVTIPWSGKKAPDQAVFARTLHLYWEEGHGVPAGFALKALRIHLDKVQVHKTQDFGWFNDGEYRLFVEAGGHWLFVNELPKVGNILSDGLGDTGEESWSIDRSFTLHVPIKKGFRVHAGGWEADGVNDVFGRLTDPRDRSERQKKWLGDHLFTRTVFLNGAEDDPIGEINRLFSAANKFGVGKRVDSSKGPVKDAFWSRQSTDPNGSYTLYYRIEEIPWP